MNGFKEQWGKKTSLTVGSNNEVTGLLNFTSMQICLSIVYTGQGTWDYPVFVVNQTSTSFKFYAYSNSPYGAVNWKVIGY